MGNRSTRERKAWGWCRWLFALAITLCGFSSAAIAQTETLNISYQATGFLYSVPSTLTLTNTGTIFRNYSGTITIPYKARTDATAGTITVEASADFSPAGGPTIGTSGGPLTYACSSATLGTNCSGTQTVSTTTATNVVMIAANTNCNCTGANDSVVVTFTLTDDPKYKTTTYTASLLWTISTP